MRFSLEKGHHNTDIDQVDAEHLSHESKETTWADLQNVPFAGRTSVSQEELFAKMDNIASFGRDTGNKENAQDNREVAPVKKEEGDDSDINLSDISATF